MGFFFTLFLFAATLVLSEFLKPKPQIENAKPAGLGDFQFPTATQGRFVPIIWGTTLIKGPNVIWSGDLQTEAITEKVKTGLFSSKRVTTGFRYRLGVQMAICRGNDDQSPDLEFLRVFIGEREFQNANGSNPLGSGISSGTVAFDNPDFLGGEDNGGRGGIVGNVTFRPGSRTQSIVTYLRTFQSFLTKTPRYAGTAFVTAERVLFGTSTQIDPWWIEARRMPDPLSLGATNIVNSVDLNPMSAIAELITNQEWGFRRPLSEINTSTFSAAATTLLSEGNGFSYTIDQPTDAADLLQDIERQIDGYVFFDRRSGLWDINLARAGDPSVLSLDETNIITINDYTRGLFENTSNIVLTQFQNRVREYADDYGSAHDRGNIEQRGGDTIQETVNYTGIKDADLANQLAARDLQTFSYPLLKAKITVDRTAYNVNPGEIVTFSSTRLNVSDVRMRVTKIDFGELLEGRIILDLVEDIFSVGQSSFASPGAGQWVLPSSTLEAYTGDVPPQGIMIEAPRAFVERDPDFPTVQPRLWFGLRNKGDGAISYDLEDVATSVLEGDAAAFFVQGSLSGDLDPSGGKTVAFEIAAGESTIDEISANLADVPAADVGNQLSQIILINNEIIGVENITDLGTTVRVDSGYRGFLDTVPESHSSNDPVYMIFVGGALADGVHDGTQKRLITEGLRGVKLGSADGFISTVAVKDRFNHPYPPARLTINGTDYPKTLDWDTPFAGVPGDGRGVGLGYVRRDFRFADEVAKHANETSLPGDFPAANTTQYRFAFQPNAGSPIAGTWASAASSTASFSRANLIWDINTNPTTLELSLDVRHTVEGNVIEGTSTVYQFTIGGTTPGRNYLGRMDDTQVRSFTAPDTGSYSFDIGDDLLNGGIVEAQINGGGYSTVIPASNSTGTLPGVTSGDTVDVRHTGVNGNAVFALLLIDPPTSTGYLAPLRI